MLGQAFLAINRPSFGRLEWYFAIFSTLPDTQATRGAATTGEPVILQVASFTTRANADRALVMLQGAGIGDATLSGADANGQKVWRLRVGPLAATVATELAERIAGLGFGLPQRVRD